MKVKIALLLTVILGLIRSCIAICKDGVVDPGELCDDYVCCNSTCNGFLNISIISATNPGCTNFTMRITEYPFVDKYRWYLLSKPPGTFPSFYNETFRRCTVQLDGNGIYLFGVDLTLGNCTWNTTYTINATDCCGNGRLETTEQCDPTFAPTGCCQGNCTYAPTGSPCNGTVVNNCTMPLFCTSGGECVPAGDIPFNLSSLTVPQTLIDYSESASTPVIKNYTYVVRYFDPDNTTGTFFWNLSFTSKQIMLARFVTSTFGMGPRGQGNITFIMELTGAGDVNFTLNVWDGCNRLETLPFYVKRWVCSNTGTDDRLEFCRKGSPYCVDNCTRLDGACGDGIVQSFELCDSAISPCCTNDCLSYKSSLQVCRLARGVCDQTEFCTGSSAECPVDRFKSNTTACGGGSTVCNPTITCTGSSPVCPTYSNFNLSSLDGLRCSTGTPPCLFPKVCKAGACVNANFTGMCRKSTGSCDPPEYCWGNGTATCPSDFIRPTGTPCFFSYSNCSYGNAACDSTGMCKAGTAGNCILRNGTYVLPNINLTHVIIETNPGMLNTPAYIEFCNNTKCDLQMRYYGSTDCLIEGQLYNQNNRASFNQCLTCDAVPPKFCDGDWCDPTPTQLDWSVTNTDSCTSTLSGSCLRTSQCGGTSSGGNFRLLGLGKTCVQTYYNSAVSCSADNNVSISPLPTGVCTGTSPWCSITSVPIPSGVCRPAAGPCDVAENFWLNGVCGDDMFMPNTTVCRPSVGPCDIPEYCSGSSPFCPPDAIQPSTYACRVNPLGDCDAIEYCNGINTSCPADKLHGPTVKCGGDFPCYEPSYCTGWVTYCPEPVMQSNGTVCRPAADSCDLAEFCVAGVCPSDVRAGNSTPCRPARGPCDVAEFCTNGACPVDTVMPANTLCRASVGPCDTPEYCDGINYDCPVDVYRSSLYICRASIDRCDAQENCTGFSTDCPINTFLGPDVTCRPANGTCDIAENCTGMNGACPNDTFKPSNTLCYTAQGLCDTNSTCTGVDAICPNNTLVPAGTVCRPKAGDCDVPETCPGNTPNCPPDSFLSSSVMCALSNATCQFDSYCTGNQSSCPPNPYKPDTFMCHVATSSCDSNAFCTGVSSDCPSPTVLPSGSYCNLDGLNCTIDQCDGAGNCLYVSQSCGCITNADCATNAPCVSGWCNSNLCQQNVSLGYCFVDNACFANGTLNPLNSCLQCRSDISYTSWVPTTAGSPCDTGSPTGSCSAQDTCNGLGLCINRYLNQSVCRSSISVCDVEEKCPGDNDYCPPDAFSGVIPCYNSTDLCDVTLYCSGVSPLCPLNIYAPSTQVCRPSLGTCDIPEYCTGNTTGCPPNLLVVEGTMCRSPVGSCDFAEYCDGVNTECPADLFRSSAFVCHVPEGMCDKPINCSGFSGTCANPERYPAGHVCRNANGTCDFPDVCDGVSTECPPDAMQPAGTVCRPINGSCDLEETCSGFSPDCPEDSLQPSGVACHIPLGPCQPFSYCTGNNKTCTIAPFFDSSVLCRPSNNSCDAPEYCPGNSDACTPDFGYPDGTSCSDGIYCNGDETCSSGTCVRSPRTCTAPACYTATCDEISASCIVLPDGPLGTSCYTGPNGTLGIGSCAGGEVTCVSGSVQCLGQVLPVDEICLNGIDDNCNGFADEGCNNNTDDCQTSDDCPYNDECQSANCVNGVCVYRVEDDLCWIDDRCWASGDRNPSNPCEVCLPTARKQHWTLISGNISDGNICNGVERCWNGYYYLEPKALTCLTQEMIPCSNATCDPILGCLVESLPDLSPCWYPEADCAQPTICLSGHCICRGRLKEIGDASYGVIALILSMMFITLMACCCSVIYWGSTLVRKEKKFTSKKKK